MPTGILQQQTQNTAQVEAATGLPPNSPLWSSHSGGNAANGQVQPIFQNFTDASQHSPYGIDVYNQSPILGTPFTPNFFSPAPTHIPHAAAFTFPPVEWNGNPTAVPHSYLSGAAAAAPFIPAFPNNFASVGNGNTGSINTPETTVNNGDIKNVTNSFNQLNLAQPRSNENNATTMAPVPRNLDPKFSMQTNETPPFIGDLNSLTVLNQLDGKRIDGQTMSKNTIDVNFNVNRMSQNYDHNGSQKSSSSSSQSWANVAGRQKLASNNENFFDRSAGLVGGVPPYQRNEVPLMSTHQFECVNFDAGLENGSWESNTSATFTQMKNTLRDSTVRQINNVPPGDGGVMNIGAPNNNPEQRKKPYQYHQQNNNHIFQQQQKNHNGYVSGSNSINNMAGRTNYRQGGVVSNENQGNANSGYFPQQHQNASFPAGNLYRPQSGGGSSGGGYRNNPYSSRTIQNPDANVHYQEGSVKQTGVNNDRDKAIIDKLAEKHNFNPRSFNCNPADAKFFVIKSYSEDDIHRSIKYSVWCSTEIGNKKLDAAFKSLNGKGPVYLFFSVNASGHFCGLAEMKTVLDYSTQAGVWQQDKWKGRFDVKWIFIKDVPNATFRHIIIESNEGKPVTQSRDSQEVPYEQGKEMLKLLFNHNSKTSMLDSFSEYENRQNFRPRSHSNYNSNIINSNVSHYSYQNNRNVNYRWSKIINDMTWSLNVVNNRTSLQTNQTGPNFYVTIQDLSIYHNYHFRANQCFTVFLAVKISKTVFHAKPQGDVVEIYSFCSFRIWVFFKWCVN